MTGQPYVVQVTGSRSFGAPAVINLALYDTRRRAAEAGARLLIVRHGDSGNADKMAARWCRYVQSGISAPAGIPVEADPVRADWDAPCRPECDHGPRRKRRDGSAYCQAQGSYRNGGMLAREPVPDECLAFVAAGLPCNGTMDCSEQSAAALIEVRFFCDQNDADGLSAPCPAHSLQSVTERWQAALKRMEARP